MTKRRGGAGPSLAELVELGKGLAHPARLRILAMLDGGELCVCQMTAVLDLAASTVSQHLAVLERGGLVTDRKEGKLVFYRLRAGRAAEEVLEPLLAHLTGDPEVRTDRAVVRRLRRVPIARLCAAELDLVAIGVRRPAPLLAPVHPRRG